MGELWPNMGYFSDSRRNWVGAFWAATTIPLVLDPWNPIWDESGLWEEQFGTLFAPLGPSGGDEYFTPNFWAGRCRRRLGPEVQDLHQKSPPPLNSKLFLDTEEYKANEEKAEEAQWDYII